MKQQTLGGFENYSNPTRLVQFLAEMNRLVPWQYMTAAIEPIYPQPSAASGH